MKTKVIGGLQWTKYREANDNRARWHAVVGGRVAYTANTLAEARAASPMRKHR